MAQVRIVTEEKALTADRVQRRMEDWLYEAMDVTMEDFEVRALWIPERGVVGMEGERGEGSRL